MAKTAKRNVTKPKRNPGQMYRNAEKAAKEDATLKYLKGRIKKGK